MSKMILGVSKQRTPLSAPMALPFLPESVVTTVFFWYNIYTKFWYTDSDETVFWYIELEMYTKNSLKLLSKTVKSVKQVQKS